MVNKKISELNELITPQGEDVIPIVNNLETKKITVDNLLSSVSPPTLKRENYLGSDCSGDDGDVNRVLVLNNVELTTEVLLFVEGLLLYPDVDYLIVNLPSSTQITFLIEIWNEVKISAIYIN